MKTLNKKTIELVKKIECAMYELDEHWQELSDDESELLSEKYPFHLSFDEMSAECTSWLINLEDKK